MARPASSSRRLRGLALASCAALAVGVAGAAPASAATTTTTTTDRSAQTLASVLRLTVNLPQANQIQIDVSTTSGAVRSVTGQGPQAEALATILRGNIAGQAQSFPGAEARLPQPLESTGQTSAISSAINSSPLGQFLAVGAVSSSAKVSPAPDSTSTASLANIGIGLPQALADALSQVLNPVLAGLQTIVLQLSPAGSVFTTVCDAVQPVVAPISGGLSQVPVFGSVLTGVLTGVTNTDTGTICTLYNSLNTFVTALSTSVSDLTGPGGLIGTGLLTSTQTITTVGAKTTAQATANLANLTVLGQNPFGRANALTTTSTAALDGSKATADVQTTAVTASAAQPLLDISTDLQTITGQLAGITLASLQPLITQITTILQGLSQIGVVAGPLDTAGAKLPACPTALSAVMSGTFTQDGVCAAAAAEGYGLTVTLPTQLQTPLGITGPLLAVQFVPTAAVVRQTVTTTTSTTNPPQPAKQMATTGLQGTVSAAGLLLLVGAAFVRRRRLGTAA